MLQLNEVNKGIKREDAGSAISSLKNSVDELIKQISNISDDKERKEIILDCSKKMRQCCEEIEKVAFLGEYGKTLDHYHANYDMTSSKMIKATMENRRRYGERVRDITLILVSFGDGISSMIEIDKELLDVAKEQWYYAAKLIREAGDSGRPKSDFLSNYEREKIANECSEKTKKAEQNYQQKLDEIAKKRFKEYWDNHQAEKVAFESEKKSLAEQIANFNKEITAIPGFTDILTLKECVEKFVKEKKALGLFKFKDKRAVQEKIDSTNKEIAQIQSRINPAIEKIQKSISQNESRIKTIDTELTKPR